MCTPHKKFQTCHAEGVIDAEISEKGHIWNETIYRSMAKKIAGCRRVAPVQQSARVQSPSLHWLCGRLKDVLCSK